MQKWISISALCLALGVGSSAQAFWGSGSDKAPPATQRAPVVVNLPDFSSLAEQSKDWVVNISTTKKIKRQIPPQLKAIPPEFWGFFGIDPRLFQDDGRVRKEAYSLGSGFIIRSDGYILTNSHVVAGADDIIVRTADRREFKAKLIGHDKATDIALLKIDIQGLPAAKLGDSRQLKVGQWVLAIGQPFGLDYTVTHGIVSAKGRSLPDESYVPFIQTDVPINPGNSGGPLINMRGEVVGINAQIFSKSGGYMGLSFAIPIEVAMNVANQLIEKGKVERGFLGVTIQEVDADLAAAFGMARPYGALVAEVGKGSAAQKAGIQPGDIIIEFDGQRIEKSTDLPPLVGMTPVGKKVKIVVLREGKRKVLWARIQAKTGDATDGATDTSSAQTSTTFGAVVAPLSEEERKQLARRFGIEYGVKVIDVTGGPAAQSGLLPGDILVSIAFRPIRTPEDVTRIVNKLPKGRKFPMRIIRRGNSLFLPLIMQ